jgi:hypothetical protein
MFIIEMDELQKIFEILESRGLENHTIYSNNSELKYSSSYDNIEKYLDSLNAMVDINKYIIRNRIPVSVDISPDPDYVEENPEKFETGIEVDIILKNKE